MSQEALPIEEEPVASPVEEITPSAEETSAVEEEIPALDVNIEKDAFPIEDNPDEEPDEDEPSEETIIDEEEQVEDEQVEEEQDEEGSELYELPIIEDDILPEEEEAAPEEQEPEEEPFVSIFEILDAPRELPEPVDLTIEHLKQIRNELGLIKLCWPEIKNPEFEDRVNFPESYLKNNEKEKLLLLYSENFRRQFFHLESNRKPLFLASDNECGLQKMVCTTLRSTTLTYPEIESWKECAKFVGEQLKYEALAAPTLIPNRLYSPHTTFLRQSGQSFEIATGLCSLLLGLSYDAYVVSGYATRDVTLHIMTRVDSPFPSEEEKEEEQEEVIPDPKYILKPPRDLRSKFLLAMAQREVDKINEAKAKEIEDRRKKMEEIEKPPFDELDGLRVHAWVLVLPGQRDIDTAFFIEPSTGAPHPTDSNLYCGVESIWNNINYWINLQDCSNGLGEMKYDLADISNWEHLLVGEPFDSRQTKVDEDMDEDEVATVKIYEEKHLDMPDPWSLRISIPHSVISQRFPNGFRKTWFKRTLVEEYAPYVQVDGLVVRICRYEDLECDPSTLLSIEERYENRKDKVVKILKDCTSGLTTEYYHSGREDAAKSHSYYNHGNLESERDIEFYHKARYDGLSKLNLNTLYMTEHYINREDYVYYRHVSYAKRGEPPPGMVEGTRRIVTRIMEKFHRNENKVASEDIASRDFAIIEREVHIKYHYAKGKVTASSRDFTKPSLAEMGERLTFNPELTIGYQAEIGAKPPRKLQLFLLFEQQLKEEDAVLYHLREMEDQILEFVRLRSAEIIAPKLEIGLFDREHNVAYRQGMLEREQQEREYKEREVEEEVDYLAPYVARLGNRSILDRNQAKLAYESCLTEFKQMLIERANYIQRNFERETAAMQDKQIWYVTVQDSLKPQDEEKYFEEVNEATFYLHTLEMRLARHRDLSPYRYEALDSYLKMDPRLSAIFKK